MPIRMLPAHSFPPYSYVPGKFPHPTTDERGHSFGRIEPPCSPPSAVDWKTGRGGEGIDRYLWGCELFNHGYYWEAHEAWESVWHGCGRTGVLADFVKGLIKLAAAGVKAREGSVEGVRRHLRRAAELFEKVDRAIEPDPWLLGLKPRALALAALEMAAKSEGIVNPSDDPVAIVMPVELYPQ